MHNHMFIIKFATLRFKIHIHILYYILMNYYITHKLQFKYTRPSTYMFYYNPLVEHVNAIFVFLKS